MSTIQDNIEKSIKVMNITFEEMQIIDEYTHAFEQLFKKAVNNVERLIRIKQKAEGKHV